MNISEQEKERLLDNKQRLDRQKEARMGRRRSESGSDTSSDKNVELLELEGFPMRNKNINNNNNNNNNSDNNTTTDEEDQKKFKKRNNNNNITNTTTDTDGSGGGGEFNRNNNNNNNQGGDDDTEGEKKKKKKGGGGGGGGGKKKKKWEMLTPEERRIKEESQDAKSFFSNERTFLGWIGLTFSLGAIGTAIITFFGSEGVSLGTGLFLWATAMLFMTYATIQFRRRGKAIRTKTQGPFDDQKGPFALVIMVMIGVTIYLVFFVAIRPEANIDFNGNKGVEREEIETYFIPREKEMDRSKMFQIQRASISMNSPISIGRHKEKIKVSIAYQPPPPECIYDHLVLVVHGIGKHEEDYFEMISKMSKKFDSIFNPTATPSSSQTNLANNNINNGFPTPSTTEPMIGKKRVKFVAIEWHAALQEMLGSLLSDVTPKAVGGSGLPKGVRSAINDTFMDYVMFNNPMFASRIYDEVTNQLNMAHMNFIQEYPSFRGKVSIYAHSLGSVISYDILANQTISLTQTSDISRFATSQDSNIFGWKQERAAQLSQEIQINGYVLPESFIHPHRDKFQPLGFKVYNFIMIGSPVGILFGLRKYKYLPIPQCVNMYNIYNNSDPVSYLVEPLIHKHFSTLPIKYIATKPKKEKSPNTSTNTSTNTSPWNSRKDKGSSFKLNQNQNQNNNNNSPPSSDDEQQLDENQQNTLTREIFKRLYEKNENQDQQPIEFNNNSNSNYNTTTNINNNNNDNQFFNGYRFDYSMTPKRFNISQYATMLTSHSDYWLNQQVLYFLGNSLNNKIL
ncbi:hypothetical protein DFA_10293 [Cavenderia fasciculata]|uniref:DDHD domain-containing protein n=1 Tax=Cavenderia fasciculata TaxID=261658 RepID=F4Q9T5_CACFS|nr:uncharacterized protein DFA_10293 [Cavenderia fasciculata]EGG15454.1 hypothetical protein DFA_10293 [Cavenderia fasciculata]|eukprot:XP_004354196.1 hypothetical protein DFA_10293 [Cavenderia fasciculata]